VAGVLCREADMKTTKELPEEEVRRVLAWCRYLLVTLRCSHWSVVLADELVQKEEEEEDVVARMHSHAENQVAVLQLCHNWHTKTPGERRHTLVHELLHLVAKEPDRIANAWLTQLATKRGFAMVQYNEAMERMVDHLASVLAPFLPQYDAEPLLLDERVGNDLRVAREGQLW
jgi:hypothetical protein